MTKSNSQWNDQRLSRQDRQPDLPPVARRHHRGEPGAAEEKQQAEETGQGQAQRKARRPITSAFEEATAYGEAHQTNPVYVELAEVSRSNNRL